MMYKFRTMYVQTEEEEKKGWTQKNDPRVTSVGGFCGKQAWMSSLSFLMC